AADERAAGADHRLPAVDVPVQGSATAGQRADRHPGRRTPGPQGADGCAAGGPAELGGFQGERGDFAPLIASLALPGVALSISAFFRSAEHNTLTCRSHDVRIA